VTQFEFLCVLCGVFFAHLAVKVFRFAQEAQESRHFNRKVRKGKAAKYAKKFKFSRSSTLSTLAARLEAVPFPNRFVR
jgi:hypothetical protein